MTFQLSIGATSSWLLVWLLCKHPAIEDTWLFFLILCILIDLWASQE